MVYPYYQNYPSYNQMLIQQQLQNMQQPQQTPQIQNGGFVMVKDINEAMNYAVAPGNSVTFKIESQPYICTKTLGFSQLDQPIFEVFRLIKEEQTLGNVEETEQPKKVENVPLVEYMTVEEADSLKTEVRNLWAEVDFLKEYIDSDKKEDKQDDKHNEST